MALPSNRNSLKNLYPTVTLDDISMADIWRSWKISHEFKDKVTSYDVYRFSEGDRWDELSEIVYGDRRLWWVLVMFNEIEDPFEIYFDKSIKSVTKTIKILKTEDLPLLLATIRDRRIKLENQS